MKHTSGPSFPKKWMIKRLNYATTLYIDQVTKVALSCCDCFVHAPSQWEMTLPCNVGSHWLGTYTKWSPILHGFVIIWQQNQVTRQALLRDLTHIYFGLHMQMECWLLKWYMDTMNEDTLHVSLTLEIPYDNCERTQQSQQKSKQISTLVSYFQHHTK